MANRACLPASASASASGSASASASPLRAACTAAAARASAAPAAAAATSSAARAISSSSVAGPPTPTRISRIGLGHEHEADRPSHPWPAVDQRCPAEREQAGPRSDEQRHPGQRGRLRAVRPAVRARHAVPAADGCEAQCDAEAGDRGGGGEQRLAWPAERRELARTAIAGPSDQRRGQQGGHDPNTEDRPRTAGGRRRARRRRATPPARSPPRPPRGSTPRPRRRPRSRGRSRPGRGSLAWAEGRRERRVDPGVELRVGELRQHAEGVERPVSQPRPADHVADLDRAEAP